jgi:alpha-glucosidase
VDERPGRFLLAELASDDPEEAIGRYAGDPDRYHTAYAFRFLSKPFSAEVIRQGVEALHSRAPEAWPSFAFSNHDFERVVTRWGEERPSPALAKTLLMLLTSLRGTAFVYQGEELGLPQAEVARARMKDPDGLAFWPAYKGRDGCRTPMPWRGDDSNGGFSEGDPWLPLDPRHLALAVDRQEADADSTLNFFRRWLSFRRSEPALRLGAIDFPWRDLDVLALDRRWGGDWLRLIFNFGQTPWRLPEDPRFCEVFRTGALGPELQPAEAVVLKAQAGSATP